ncbi:histidine phosphatase family protein [Halomonas urumqiensis]|uniref:Histidine phosphatase family protein n=1 Tax=Halomonas urumqiensis TaxID=1684789 RepID=A0A2N7UJ87_9GAMM|nr:histidine phosphatase family protein [Halomonas urumqiensis]PMR80503.1 histidine phosphatase family protein [Halomonas urumqiensis]PTB01652.1 histidine phosphatase family protein [Halomonas urumqiensis]GHE22262.1 phosphoglycerate mutase [Halomonas urumqiensis]
MLSLRHLSFALMLSVLGTAPSTARASEATWQALQEGGLVVLMRHALAPGVGDPPEFERGRCDTQRNLSAAGRTQAEAAGRALRQRDIPIDEVFSSQWCRALDTAELMDVGEVAPAPWLDSFFRERSEQAARTQRARERILDWQGPGNLLLITHQVNISALTGNGAGSGDMLVVRPDGDDIQSVGRLRLRAE